jgi:uncharacterized membrane protein YecN with MAPEG domain
MMQRCALRSSKMSLPALAPFLALCSAFALMVTGLGLAVSLRRLALKGVDFGDAGDVELRHRIRRHGNFAEYAPLALMTVLALCLAGLPGWMAWLAAGLFLATRLGHAWALGHTARTPVRAAAMGLQHLTFVVSALALLVALI